MANKTLHNKKALLQSLEKTLGVVTTACRKVGISRTTFYDYYKKDSKFKKEVDGLSEVALDFVESKLFEQIKKNNPTSTIFYLKTKGKKRNYIEQNIIEHKGGIESKLIEWKPSEKKQ
jgi:predicted DNA-binding transcriptional regulator AlpA|tara:strand:- start:33 stop:386 length:354 start_codon:yes stop_codon:yes gene_type:complete